MAHSGRDKSQVARLVAGLKDRGLLGAQADEGGRRSVRLQLTPEGRAIQQDRRHQSRRISGVAVTGLSQEECRQLIALLQRVEENLKAAS